MHFEKRTPLFLEQGFHSKSLPQLKKYVDLLWATNEELNLISRKMTYEELIDNHVIDCMLALPHFPKTNIKAVADFGSGGGLPGVLFAIQFPEIKFHLFEKSPKKREHLNRCKVIAPNIEVHAEITPKLPAIDLITARAFKPLDVILELSRNYYGEGGHYFLLKGRAEKINEELLIAQKKFKDLQTDIVPLRSPLLDVQRHIVKI